MSPKGVGEPQGGAPRDGEGVGEPQGGAPRDGNGVGEGEFERRLAGPSTSPPDTELAKALAVASSLHKAQAEAVADPAPAFAVRLRNQLLVEAAGLVRPQHPASGEVRPPVAAASGLLDRVRRGDWRHTWWWRRRAAIGIGAALVVLVALAGWMLGRALDPGEVPGDTVNLPPGNPPGTSIAGGAGPTDSTLGVPPSTGGLPGVLPTSSSRRPRSTATSERPVTSTTGRTTTTTRPAAPTTVPATTTTLPVTSTTLPATTTPSTTL